MSFTLSFVSIAEVLSGATLAFPGTIRRSCTRDSMSLTISTPLCNRKVHRGAYPKLHCAPRLRNVVRCNPPNSSKAPQQGAPVDAPERDAAPESLLARTISFFKSQAPKFLGALALATALVRIRHADASLLTRASQPISI
jgi:hypothetical protein